MLGHAILRPYQAATIFMAAYKKVQMQSVLPKFRQAKR